MFRAAWSSLLFTFLAACSSGSSDGITVPGSEQTGGAKGQTGGSIGAGPTSGSGAGGAIAPGSGGSANGGTVRSEAGGAGSGGSKGGAATGGSSASGGSVESGGGPMGGTPALGGKGGTAGTAVTGGTAGAAGAGGSGGAIGGGAGAGPAGIPEPAGACPEFVQGDVTFNPLGGARRVAMSIGSAAKSTSGPLIFYWFATGSDPAEAEQGLPLSTVLAAGGIVVAPYDVSGAGVFPWLSQLTQHDALFDEVLACAQQKTLIDTRRIHALGFSAGALMTTHLSYARSKFMASVATYSGGQNGMFQEPNNKFAAMIMAGGMGNDRVVQDFHASSVAWQNTLKTAGHFAMLCDHGGGHRIPTGLVPGVWQFFVDHPFGKNPSPYAGGKIPSGIGPPCVE